MGSFILVRLADMRVITGQYVGGRTGSEACGFIATQSGETEFRLSQVGF